MSGRTCNCNLGAASDFYSLSQVVCPVGTRRCRAVMQAGTARPPPIGFAGPLEGMPLRGDRATAPLQHICVFRFLRFVCPIRFSKGNANAAHRSGRGHDAGLVEARPGVARPVFRGVRQCGVAARPGCDAGLASEAAPKQAARRSGRSGGLCDFGSRHGASAERVALENGRCRSRDRTVGTLRPCSPSGRRAPPRHHLHPRKGRPSVDLGQRQRSFGAHAMFSRT